MLKIWRNLIMEVIGNNTAFVYKWIELSTGKWYIGSRIAKGAGLDDGYICSSRIVKPLIETNPLNWRREILQIGQAKEMILLETKILHELDAKNNSQSYNMHNGDGKFTTHKNYPKNRKSVSEEVLLKRSNALMGRTSPMKGKSNAGASLALRGKPGNNKGKKMPNISEMKKGIPRSQEVKDKISSSLKGRPNIGGIKLKGIPKPKLTCIHCHKLVSIQNLSKYHNANCKLNIPGE